jgi:hypothetical protein
LSNDINFATTCLCTVEIFDKTGKDFKTTNSGCSTPLEEIYTYWGFCVSIRMVFGKMYARFEFFTVVETYE